MQYKRIWLRRLAWLLPSVGVLLGLTWYAWYQLPIVIFGYPTNARDNADPGKRTEMLRILVNGIPVAPLPAGAVITDIHTGGNPFARQFYATFSTSKTTISSWIADSTSLREAEKIEANGITTYTIDHPANGTRASVVVNWVSGQVVLYMETG
jgi:hypothetical protein